MPRVFDRFYDRIHSQVKQLTSPIAQWIFQQAFEHKKEEQAIAAQQANYRLQVIAKQQHQFKQAFAIQKLKNLNVQNVMDTLQEVIQYYGNKFSIPAITSSNHQGGSKSASMDWKTWFKTVPPSAFWDQLGIHCCKHCLFSSV